MEAPFNQRHYSIRTYTKVSYQILNNYHTDCKNRLLKLHILPLMYIYELQDLMFFDKSYKKLSPHFDIRNFIAFPTWSTGSASSFRLVQLRHHILAGHHSYFARLVRLWNSLLAIDITLSDYTIKTKIIDHFWINFSVKFNSNQPCSFHYLCPCNQCFKLPHNPTFDSL